MKHNVYFAGSIRGGRTDADLYRCLIDKINETDHVLTEHVGDLSLSSLEEANRDRQIYLQDTGWLDMCDLVIAECTTPSLGVGYEMAYAEKRHKPVYILYNRQRTQLSAMLTGDDYFHIYPYETAKQALAIVAEILKEFSMENPCDNG